MTEPLETTTENTPTPKRRRQSGKHVLVSTTQTPHKVMNAGQAIIFVLVTVLVGTILNASSMYTKASAMQPSLKRDVAMTTLRPFDIASRAIGLTSLRQQPRQALGLNRDDKIDTFTFEDTKKKVAAPKPKVLPLLGPENKLNVWIIGDSLSITPGESMTRNLPADAFNILGLQGQVSTGLARPDVFNWFTNINDFVVANKPGLVVATFGANDDQYLFGPSGAIGPFGSQNWKNEYATRVGSTLDFLANQGVRTLWIEIPPVRDPARRDRYSIINEVVSAEVKKRPDSATWVETKQAFTNPDGSYSDAIVINGVPTLLRAPDGIHFTRAGGDVISSLVLAKLRELYRFG